jgi:hypothetical protein
MKLLYAFTAGGHVINSAESAGSHYRRVLPLTGDLIAG